MNSVRLDANGYVNLVELKGDGWKRSLLEGSNDQGFKRHEAWHSQTSSLTRLGVFLILILF